jgi:hypothetical protein
MRPTQIRIAVLATVCVALGVAWVSIETSPIEPLAASNAAKANASAPALNQLDQFNMPPVDSFSEIDVRPVFSPSRRPLPPAPVAATHAPTAPAPPPPQAAPVPANLTLVGIITGSGEHFALIRVAGSATLATVAEGQEVGGWRVHLILPDRIVVRSAATETEITFPQHGPAQPGRPAAVPAASRPPINLVPPAAQFSLKSPG